LEEDAHRPRAQAGEVIDTHMNAVLMRMRQRCEDDEAEKISGDGIGPDVGRVEDVAHDHAVVREDRNHDNGPSRKKDERSVQPENGADELLKSSFHPYS